MADAVLNKVLGGEIKTGTLFQWLRNSDVQDGVFGCSQGEFLSHFLNFIHEKALSFDKSSETPRKVHTPKSIRKVQLSRSETKPKRTNLFPEPGQNINDSLVELESRIGSKNLLHELNSPRDGNLTNPLSPIYAQPNTSTPRTRNRSFDDKTLCLGDFITYAKKSNSKSSRNSSITENIEPSDFERRKSRRINPTNLNKKFSSLFSSSENSYNFKDASPEISADNIWDQRNILAAERLKISSRKLDDSQTKIINKITPTKIGKEILPDLSLISCKEKLDCLIEIYLHLLNNNFSLNITSEIYFLLSLALTKQYETDSKIDDEDNPNKIFKTIHNTYYFAIKVLEAQISILKVLEKPCLRFLYSNERLRPLCKESDFNSETLVEKSDGPGNVEAEQDSQVCFMSETDNRENFPSETSFHAFRKQRDLFYEILRIWEQNRFQDGWNFTIGLGGKIKMLFNLCGDPANFRHFCRLFKQQLLATCSNTNEEGLSDSQLPFLSSIPNINSEKLSRLKSRLVTKSSTNGINALPTFPGYQEFYREFIETAAMHTLNVHLKNSFIQDILTLNESKFSNNELEEQDTVVDAETKNSYLICIKSLRLVAKFLGFLDSIPYRKQSNVPDKVLTAEIETRMWEQPIFDLNRIVSTSHARNTLILTIPWVTKYLSMLDHVTLRLVYFETIYDLLFEVYYSTPDERRSFASNMLIKLSLGWLFELPHFPSELYFSWCTKRITGAWTARVNSGEGQLDSLDIIDKNLIYTCCPYLNEFKKLLQYNCAKNGTISIKHITPISAVESPVQINEKRLKLQLEEAFFTGHPTSMRKTVEFVSERVASACVKNICNVIVPRNKSEVLAKLKSEFKYERVCRQVEAELRTKFNKFIQDQVKSLQSLCREEMEQHVSLKICDSISLLLSDEEMQQTKDTCATIASRMCRERVQLWLNTHINEGIFSKDLDVEFVRIIEGHPKEVKTKLVFSLPTLGSKLEHNSNTWGPAYAVDRIRTLTREVIENSPDINTITVTETLESIRNTLKQRCDVNECIVSLINKMLLDLVIILIAYKSEMCNNNLYSKFTSFWKEDGVPYKDMFKTIVSPRNIAILNQSSDRTSSWNGLTKFIVILLQQNLLDCEEFESECIGIYRQNWNKNTLLQLSTCFQNIAGEFNNQPYAHSKFAFLMSYLSDFCSDMDIDVNF